MAVEGTPLLVEDNAEDEHKEPERRKGIFEFPRSGDGPSLLERAWADAKPEPEPQPVERPAAELPRFEPPALPELVLESVQEIVPAETPRPEDPEANRRELAERLQREYEASRAAGSEVVRETPVPVPERPVESAQTPVTEQNIETLNRVELMAQSEQVSIDGTSLQQIYETHLIGERGLRRLMAEHLRGGDLHEALQREIMERERDFERDPVMRDVTVSAGGPSDVAVSAATAAGSADLDHLLQKAKIDAPGRTEEAAFFKARARYQAAQHQRQHHQRRIIDIAMAAVIIILVALVVVMYMLRH